MSDSDTYLDSILEGLTAPEEQAQANSKRPSAKASTETTADDETVADPKTVADQPEGGESQPASALDGILNGITTAPVTEPDSEGPEPEAAVAETTSSDATPDAPPAGQPSTVGEIEQVDPGVLIGTGDLDLATPQDILGLPPEPTGAASHMELAHEVNAVASAPAIQEPEARSRWESNHSFAAIARDISATVELTAPEAARRGGKTEGEHASFYVRTRRRRRQKRMNRVTVTQVVGITLLLVLGLGGEYEYVSKSAGPPTPVVPIPTDLTSKLPVVALSPVAGTVFHFRAAGAAQTTAFKITSAVTLQSSAHCSKASTTSVVEVGLRSGGFVVAEIAITAKTAAPVAGKPAVLKPGTYNIVIHAPATCIWNVQGRARA